VAFTTVAKVKEALRIPAADTTFDALLATIVASVDSTFLTIFGLTSTDPTAYTNLYDIDDSETEGIWLLEYPVISVDEVKFAGTVQVLTSVYLRNPKSFGMLKLLSGGVNGARMPGTFPFGAQIVEVTHTAGWATVPDDLCGAATSVAVLRFNTDPKLGYDSEKIGQYSYKLGSPGGGSGGESSGGGFPGTVNSVLAHHRRPFATRN